MKCPTQKIRISIGALDYSQIQLAKLIGVSPKAIDYWERNVNEPKASYIIALVNIFEVAFDDFLLKHLSVYPINFNCINTSLLVP